MNQTQLNEKTLRIAREGLIQHRYQMVGRVPYYDQSPEYRERITAISEAIQDLNRQIYPILTMKDLHKVKKEKAVTIQLGVGYQDDLHKITPEGNGYHVVYNGTQQVFRKADEEYFLVEEHEHIMYVTPVHGGTL